jgi:aspartyl protease family protein
MKKTIIYFSILIPSIIFSQYTELLKDDFSFNNNNWSESKYENSESFFRNGQYFIIGRKKGFYHQRTIEMRTEVDDKKDYTIKVSITLNWEKDGDAYFIFGKDSDNDNYHYIRMRKKDYSKGVFIGKKIDGEHVGIWEYANINSFGEANKIEIIKTGNSIYYHLNSRLIYSKKAELFFGNRIGFACGNQNVSFDNLSIKGYEKHLDDGFSEKQYNYNTERKKNYSSSSSIKLKKNNGVYEIPAELNGVLKINFIFDSGASDTSISPDIALTLIKTGTIKTEDWLEGQYYSFANGSSAKSERFILREVKIGDKTIKNVTCRIANNINAPMLLGQSVLRKFGKYTFDYSNDVLIIDK